MTPEQKAREEIDDQLHQTGWAVQSAAEMDITAARGVAVREFPLKTGYADAKALDTIEAKPEGHSNDRTLMLVGTGRGRSVPGVVPRKASIVHREAVEVAEWVWGRVRQQ